MRRPIRRAMPSRSLRPPPPPPPPARGKTGSVVSAPAPRFVVVRGWIEIQLMEPPHRILHDAAALGDLRSVVRTPHFIMEQLAARIAEQLLQLRRRIEQATVP